MNFPYVQPSPSAFGSVWAQVRYIGVSNETSYGVMKFVQTAEAYGLPKIVSIQNSYSLLVTARSPRPRPPLFVMHSLSA